MAAQYTIDSPRPSPFIIISLPFFCLSFFVPVACFNWGAPPTLIPWISFFLPLFVFFFRSLSSLLWYFGIFLCLLWYFGGKCRCKCPRWLSPRLALHLHRATESRQQKSEKKRRRKFNYTIGFNNAGLRSSNSNSP